MKGISPAVAFVAPSLCLIVVFFGLPVLLGLALSFTDFDIYALADRDTLRWIGWDNYRRLFHDPLFWTAISNTLRFVIVGVPCSIVLALSLALLLNHPLARAKTIFRTIFFLPVVATLVAVAIAWRYLLHPRSGWLNVGLASLGLPPIDWLGDPAWSLPALILLATWKNLGFNLVIFISGLQTIPVALYEAAAIDGAKGWLVLRDITLPQLGPTLGFVTLTTLIGYLQVFAEPYVMTQGGPSDSTLTIVLLMYQQGFRWWNMGYAATIAGVLLVIIVLITSIARRFRKDWA